MKTTVHLVCVWIVCVLCGILCPLNIVCAVHDVVVGAWALLALNVVGAVVTAVNGWASYRAYRRLR